MCSSYYLLRLDLRTRPVNRTAQTCMISKAILVVVGWIWLVKLVIYHAGVLRRSTLRHITQYCAYTHAFAALLHKLHAISKTADSLQLPPIAANLH